ncbi:MAG TPA: site-specific DNA-methyltransferase [Clostridiales bacterium]|nr:site-specific DNA-methyltransferase [Clostridiales bacterium]
MDKLKMQTANKADENFLKLAAMFPNAVTETIDENGELVRAIDKDILMQEISCKVVDGNEERYQFTWPDKKKSVLLANAPISKTLRPCREESVDFDNTENLYIEGDNLEVLKLLQETYLGKIKMIYIDPPYNTGNDFVYEDNFAQSTDEYLENSGQFDDEGNRLVKNLDSNGRFHTDWLNMIYPRLKLAKDLLSDNGVIFISIGKAENHNLIKCCDDIFSEANRVGIISRMMKSGGNKGMYFSPNMEYILVYAKNINSLGYFREPISAELIAKVYNQVETSGERAGQKYRTMGLYQAGLDARPNQRYWIQCPDGSFAIPQGKTFPSEKFTGSRVLPQDGDGVWRWSADRLLQELKNNNILFKQTNTSSLVDENGNQSKWNIYTKIWLSDRLDEGRVPVDLITKWENRISSQELKDLDIPFDFAKPTELIKYLVSLVDKNEDSYVLDFFSGSATTAHAVMQLNAEDGGNRKFIMVQLPEQTDEKSEAYKAGYKNICEIGKERIRRAAKKIAEDNPEAKFDGGFRVLKCDTSNMKDVYYTPDDYPDSLFDLDPDNIKEDRTPEDLLFQVMLDLGVLLSSKIEETNIAGKKVFSVEDNYLIACFDNDVTDEVVKEIAKKKPYYFVMRDSSMASDSVATNFEQIFATFSPSTVRKVM